MKSPRNSHDHPMNAADPALGGAQIKKGTAKQVNAACDRFLKDRGLKSLRGFGFQPRKPTPDDEPEPES